MLHTLRSDDFVSLGNKRADNAAKDAAMRTEPFLTCVVVNNDSFTLPSDSLTAMQAFATAEKNNNGFRPSANSKKQPVAEY